MWCVGISAAVTEMQQPSFYHSIIFKLLKMDRYINVLREYVEKK
jgi:hypothetical protein